MTTGDLELNAAICVYLKNYPGRNHDHFSQVFADLAEPLRARVHEILRETMKIDLDWMGLTLSDGGDAVKAIMAERHPELRAEALDAIRRYYTFLMRLHLSHEISVGNFLNEVVVLEHSRSTSEVRGLV